MVHEEHFLFLLIKEIYHSFTSIIYHYCSLSFTLVIQNRSFDNGMHVIFTFFLVVLLLTHHINWSHWLSIVYLFLSGISYDLINCKPVVLWTTFHVSTKWKKLVTMWLVFWTFIPLQFIIFQKYQANNNFKRKIFPSFTKNPNKSIKFL